MKKTHQIDPETEAKIAKVQTATTEELREMLIQILIQMDVLATQVKIIKEGKNL